MNPNTHGGPRPGAGRPKKADAKRTLSAKLAPDVIDYLKSTDAIATTIETTIRNSKGYKQWKRKKNNFHFLTIS